jgi:outer membrane receptor protein involved in Fe transport
MRFRTIFFSFLTFLTLEVFAQKGAIEGSITDAESRTPVNGAAINVAGDKGDNSDIFGKFSIPAVNPGQYEMKVSHIGYKTEIILIEVRSNLLSTININLKKDNLDLDEVRINSKKTNGLNSISILDIKLRPLNTSQDVLRIVPGLFIAQHAGGGKAEQIFLRGFDIDHGTDIAITVDGMPVNMVSHAHGQGYADLHFLIPETVEKIGFDKGPYFATKGNFATAAYVDFSTKEFLETNSVKAEAGQNNTQRIVGLMKLFNKSNEKNRRQFYVASEYLTTDGYFESPQDFLRFNLMGKYNAWFGNHSQLSVTASNFKSKWNASGQIPDRAVKEGIISRLGAIDDTEGGMTSRTHINVRFNKQGKNKWKTSDQFYIIHYKFNLYSNFTFFLEDDVHGDMINQKEKRNIFGFNKTAVKTFLSGNKKATTEFGIGFRYDRVKDIELAKANRYQFFNSIQKGDVRELNSFIYINLDIELSDKLNLNAGLRYDDLTFKYKDELAGNPGFIKQKKGIASPKLNISYSPNAKIKLYLNNGIGFHSNDTRVILDKIVHEVLPKTYGSDLGIILKPNKALVLKTALWHFYSKQEFVYVGDAGIVEPGGKTRRIGMDVSARYQFTKWLFGDIDLNLTKARAIAESKGDNLIPLSPSFTSIGGITVKAKQGFSGSLRYRFLDSRPADETNSVNAQGYLLMDAIATYKLNKFEFSLSGENLLNRNWREAQFKTTSKLKFETVPLSEIHYTPGTPRYFKASVSFHF